MSEGAIMSGKDKGSVMVFFGLILLTLTGFAILAVDIGRIFIVRNEMQNVADSAALAGANCLTRQSAATGSNCSSTMATSLNWTRAAAKAADQLSKNTAANNPIASSGAGQQIDVGYWSLSTGNWSGGAASTTFTPVGQYDKPAVRVTITKDTGKNNGPIFMLTRAMFGGSDVPMTASAVAVISSPSTVQPSSLIPQIINKCMYDLFWDATTGQPRTVKATDNKNDPTLNPNGLAQTVGQPWEFLIGSSYHYGTCDSGQWTSFTLNSQSASDMKNLINNGNPSELETANGRSCTSGADYCVFIQSGTENSGYKALDDKYPNGADVSVVVVDTTDLTNGGVNVPIVAFAGFHIDDVQGGSGKYIQGHFISNGVTAGSGGIGSFYGTYTPPRLGYVN
jgi:Flp pilus assembly protein TadG